MIEINQDFIIEKVIQKLKEVKGQVSEPDCRIARILILQLVAQGFGVDDFILVIEKKAAQWRGTKYEQFIRPQTLFGAKFQIYLHERAVERISTIEKLSRAVEQSKNAFRGLDTNSPSK